MLPTDDPNKPTLNITTADVLRILIRIIDVEGLDAAWAAFKQMNIFLLYGDGQKPQIRFIPSLQH